MEVSETLVPVQAILQDEVITQNPIDSRDASIISRMQNKSFLIVMFKGLESDGTLNPEDMKWLVTDTSCNRFEPIGFGFPVLDRPFFIVGQLIKSGSIEIASGTEPLLELIYFVPNDISEILTLSGSGGSQHTVKVSSDWQPIDENLISGLVVKENGVIGALLQDSGWCSTILQPCP